MSLRLPTRFRTLDERIFKSAGRRGHEPPGQDGSSCLLLAALDQAEELGFVLGLSTTDFRRAVRAWLIEWKTLIIDSDWNRSGQDEIGLLCDAGPDYWQFLKDPTAVGTHTVLLAVCGVLSELTSHCFEAKVSALIQKLLVCILRECLPSLLRCTPQPPLH